MEVGWNNIIEFHPDRWDVCCLLRVKGNFSLGFLGKHVIILVTGESCQKYRYHCKGFALKSFQKDEGRDWDVSTGMIRFGYTLGKL